MASQEPKSHEGTKETKDTRSEQGAEAPESLRDSFVSSCLRGSVLSWVLLAIVLIVGAVLRVSNIDYSSLTFDEQWHLELSTGRGSPHVRVPEDTLITDAPAVTSLVDAPPWYAVWSNMDFVVHPPLYCTLLRLWRDAFGPGDIAARSLSIVFSLIAITLMFLAGRALNGPAVALWAAAIWAVAPSQVFLAQQVRGYDLLLAVGMGTVLALVHIEKSEKASPAALIALGLCLLGMMLTHYFAIGPCVALGVYGLIRFRGVKLRNVIITGIMAAAIYMIIWGPFLWQQRNNVTDTADPWLMGKASPVQHVIDSLYHLATWPWRLTLDIGSQTPFPLMSAIVLIAPLILLRKQRDLLLWILWLCGTLLFVAALDLFRGTIQLNFIRYVSFATPAIFMLMTASLGRAPRELRHAIPALIVVIALFNQQAALMPQEREPDWRQLGAVIDQHVQPGEAILFYNGMQAPWFDEILYLGSAHYSHAFPRPMVRLSGPASAQLMRQLPGQSAWLITWPLKGQVSDILPGATVTDDYEVKDLAYCYHVRLNSPTTAEMP